MSLLKIFQSKRATDSTAPATTPTGPPPSAAPTASNRAGSSPSAAAPASPETAAAVKSILSAFAEEATADSAKIEAIGKQLSNVQTMLSSATDSRRAPEANARARDEIKAILSDLRTLHAEFKTTSRQLQQMSR